MKNLQEQLKSKKTAMLLNEFRIGLEKESQRVTSKGELADTPHPKKLGSRSFHPYIQTDFSETQIELITQVFDTNRGTLRQLSALHEVVLRSMEHNEELWPLSMPPALPIDDTNIVIAKLEDQGDINYRRYLAKVYGKRKQMVSGIHYNFEFSDELITLLFNEQDEYVSIKEFRTALYMKISRQYLRYRWLLTYLFGASPYADENYFTTESLHQPVRSIRNSQYGYTNRPDIKVSYHTLEEYTTDLMKLVNDGELIEAKEFYASVRLRGGGGRDVQDLVDKGVQYIELRNIDLDPFEKVGISIDTLDFIHLFLMTLLYLEEESTDADKLIETGELYNNTVALENPLSKTEFYEEGAWLLEEMGKVNELLHETADYTDVLNSTLTALENPSETLAGRMVTEMTEKNWTNTEFGQYYAKKYHDIAFEKPYQLAGYRGMELSTQILMFDAIQKGIHVEVLDENDQFLKLTFNNHVEYVKNANMTSHDSYIVPLLMENKTVTKKVLHEAGFRVPLGKEFSTIEEALSSFGVFQDKAIVIKPKTTNYGLGISIFKDGATYEDYKVAVEIAFKEDDHILVEEFLPGTEYRFFVLDGKTRGVMLRTPANVVGDGEHTIAELVAEKNTDVLRGTHHRSPLEIIKLSDIEKLMLKEQGLTVDSIPSEGKRVYLRENSNVSTGGDSLDVTDDMPESYKKIAEEAVDALGAVVCGIDLIIPDKEVKGVKDSTTYGIIEGNFNPAMHMHIYPYAGESRRLTMDVLHMLYPEAFK